MRPLRAFFSALCIGVFAAGLQLYASLLHTGAESVPRGVVTVAAAVAIGVFAGLRYKTEAAWKAAAFMGFVAGMAMTIAGLWIAFRNLPIGEIHSIQSGLSFSGALAVSVVVASWMISAISMLVALLIRSAISTANKTDTESAVAQ
jgi:hypothetical protein